MISFSRNAIAALGKWLQSVERWASSLKVMSFELGNLATIFLAN